MAEFDIADFDIVVLGGGLVGCSLACGLEGKGLRVALLESRAPGPAAPASYDVQDARVPRRAGSPGAADERRLALAAATINALDALGVLAALPSPPSPLRRIHVSRSGDFGSVRLEAAEFGRDAFGGVVSARELGLALEARLAALRDTRVLRPCTLQSIVQEAGGCRLEAVHEGKATTLRTALLVAADGTHSFARAQLGIGAQEHDYGQTLFVGALSTDRPADGTAYERFTAHGPTALLPMGRDYGAICAVANADAARVAALDDGAYADYFQQRFGWRAGRVERVGRRSAHPIVRVLAERCTQGRVVLVGNAAQTIHPVGAQGFNLGLRDALALAQLVQAGADPGAPELLAAHVEARREDRARTLAFSDGLARLTANPSEPLRALRSLGLLALGNLPGLAAPLVAGAMGLRGEVPALSRGRA
jgi:2-octaprenyl-6-methoxyphenol hydroxylase